MSSQEVEQDKSPEKPGRFARANQRVIEYFGTFPGRGTFLLITLIASPLIVVGQCWVAWDFFSGATEGLLGSPARGIFLTCTLITSFYALVFLARRLSWYIEQGALYRPQPAQLHTNRLSEDEKKKASYQEFRAQGRRIVVDGVAFQYGQSRSFFERAPWYRN